MLFIERYLSHVRVEALLFAEPMLLACNLHPVLIWSSGPHFMLFHFSNVCNFDQLPVVMTLFRFVVIVINRHLPIDGINGSFQFTYLTN